MGKEAKPSALAASPGYYLEYTPRKQQELFPVIGGHLKQQTMIVPHLD